MPMHYMQKGKSGSPVRRFEQLASTRKEAARKGIELRASTIIWCGTLQITPRRAVLNFLRLLDQSFGVIRIRLVLAQHAMRVEETGIQCDREPHHFGECFGGAVEHGNDFVFELVI